MLIEDWIGDASIDALGVWHDLERALAGKNSYGGDVAEIYAYRLVPGGAEALTAAADSSKRGELAAVAGKNMTRLLRLFVQQHENIIVEIDGREGFRTLEAVEEFPSFDWRVHLRIGRGRLAQPVRKSPTPQKLRESLAIVAEHNDVLITALDELADLRAKERLRADVASSSVLDDLPPDAPTGLYLDCPFDIEDFAWIKMAWDALLHNATHITRAGQLMLVFQAIRRDERSAKEFLRVMNTIVLPLCRRIRLKEQPQLAKLGMASL